MLNSSCDQSVTYQAGPVSAAHAARKQISMIKVAVAKVYQDIADRCIQLFGTRGVTGDTPAARAFGEARAFRIYDDPDEVHLQTIARLKAGEQSLAGLEHYLHE